MLFKVRLLVLGLLSMMLFGAVASTSALAEPGPFWHHREVGGKGEGEKIEQKAPEGYTGIVNQSEFVGKIGGTELKLKGEAQVSGGVWNGPDQGQAKIQVKFFNVVANNIANCTAEVKVPQDYNAHLMWKYRGFPKELENKNQILQGQEWDGLVIPQQSKLGPKGPEGKNIFAIITLGSKCGVISGLKGNVEGFTGFNAPQVPLESFSKEPILVFPGGILEQHFWNGQEFVPIRLELTFNNELAKFFSQGPIKFQKQEVGVFEK
jgi:hypothetical protein